MVRRYNRGFVRGSRGWSRTTEVRPRRTRVRPFGHRKRFCASCPGRKHARLWCARRTGERQGVQVPRDEGVTNHVSPRAVRRRREGSGEASVAVHVGGLMSIEKAMFRSAEAFRSAEGNTGGLVMVRGRRAPRCQRTHARMKAFRRDLGVGKGGGPPRRHGGNIRPRCRIRVFVLGERPRDHWCVHTRLGVWPEP